MSSSDQDIPQKSSFLAKWLTPRSCTLGCLGYIAGIVTLPLAVSLFLNTPDIKKQRFLERESNECRGCDLSNLDLSLRNWSDADFSKANLQNTILGAAKLGDANFAEANLQGAVLRQANLANANFEGANLSQADFSCGGGTCTYLSNTSFKNANLRGADFQLVGFTPAGEVGLPQVDFTEADLREANFEGASLKGALLDQAKLCGTRMPDGTISNRDC